MMDDEAMSANEAARDDGESNPMIEAQRQAWAQQQFASNAAGQLIGAPYFRSDYDIRAACLEAAVRTSNEGRDVLADARSFHAFLTEKSS